MVPAARSPLWALVFVLLTLVIAGSITALDVHRRHNPPAPDAIATVFGVMAVVSAVLSLIGWLGGRATATCTSLGLLGGLVYMIAVSVNRPTDGMADLGALIMFMMFGFIGFVLGVVLDVLGAIRARRAPR